MKKYRTYILIALLSVVLGAAIGTSSSEPTLGACLNSPLCRPENVKEGQVRHDRWGFPVAYDEEIRVDFSDGSGAGSTVPKSSLWVPVIIFVNSVFWFGFLYGVYALYINYKER